AVMALMGIASGMLIVPLEAILQWRAPDDRRGSVIALANVLIFSGVLAGSLATFALSRAGVSSRGVLMAAAVATLAGTVWALRCTSAGGQITRTGMLLPFRRGLERIVKGRTAPIIPVHLDRVWGSIFSRAHGRFVTKWPERIPYPVTVSFGTPMPPDVPLHEVRRAVLELGEAAATLRKDVRRPLHRQFAREARHRPFSFVFGDATRPRVSRLGALAGAIALARAVREPWK